MTLHENGEIVTAYRDLDEGVELGSSATIGIENAAGTDALEYSYNQAVLTDDWAVRYTPPASQ